MPSLAEQPERRAVGLRDVGAASRKRSSTRRGSSSSVICWPSHHMRCSTRCASSSSSVRSHDALLERGLELPARRSCGAAAPRRAPLGGERVGAVEDEQAVQRGDGDGQLEARCLCSPEHGVRREDDRQLADAETARGARRRRTRRARSRARVERRRRRDGERRAGEDERRAERGRGRRQGRSSSTPNSTTQASCETRDQARVERCVAPLTSAIVDAAGAWVLLSGCASRCDPTGCR